MNTHERQPRPNRRFQRLLPTALAAAALAPSLLAAPPASANAGPHARSGGPPNRAALVPRVPARPAAGSQPVSGP